MAAFAVLLAACGGDSDDFADLDLDLDLDLRGDILSTPENLLPPCSLVTREQAESVLGFAVDAPRPGKDSDTCIYEETDPNGFGGTVIVSQPNGFGLFDRHSWHADARASRDRLGEVLPRRPRPRLRVRRARHRHRATHQPQRAAGPRSSYRLRQHHPLGASVRRDI